MDDTDRNIYNMLNGLYHPEIPFNENIFEQLCKNIYTYKDIYATKYTNDSIYYIGAYLEALIVDYSSKNQMEVINKIYNFLDKYKVYNTKIKNTREELRQFTLKHCSDDFTKTYDICDGKYESVHLDIMYHFRLQRDIYRDNEDPEIQNPKISEFIYNFNNTLELNRKIYLYHEVYVNKLMYDMNKIKYDIIKYEISRYGKEIGGVFDILLNQSILEYIKKKKEFTIWFNKMNNLNIDKYFLYNRTCNKSNPCIYNQQLFQMMTGNKFCARYDLPISVLKYYEEHPNGWASICSKSRITGEIYPVPKIYNGQLCIS